MAKERGVKIVISTDAHTTRGLLAMRYGVQMARRGWLEKKDVINTMPVEKLLATLRAKPGASPRKREAASAGSKKSKARKSS
jgi:DNA polymerase (family 10)